MSKWVYVGLVAAVVAVTVWFTDTFARASYQDALTAYLAKPVQERKTDNPFIQPVSRDTQRLYQYGPPPTREQTADRVWRVGGGIIVLELAAGVGLYHVLQRRGVLT